MTCDICGGTKRIILPTRADMVVSGDGGRDDFEIVQTSREFDCPQCTSMVPYRRVRAMKIATAYEVEQFAQYATPIQRSLAARFGEYLMREGLIRFSTTGSKDTGAVADKITITAHLGVVAREDVLRAGADPEVAITKPPPLPKRVRERVKVSVKATRWVPQGRDETDADAFEDEPKSAITKRFSGLEI